MEAAGTDEVEKIKTKFMSAWNNMKYSWVLKTKTYFSRNSPVFLLGKCYHFKTDERDELSPNGSSYNVADEVVSRNVEEFRKDFISRIWLTYREEFPLIKGSALTTDCGWGCTLRTGQMLLAQGLIIHFLSRDWTWQDAFVIENPDTDSWTSHTVKKFTASLEASLPGDREFKNQSNHHKQIPKGDWRSTEMREEYYHRKIISWFGDYPAANFGLHRLIEYGNKSGKIAGDWYGPAVVAHLLRKAVEEARDPELKGINVYVAQDCTVYKSDVVDNQCSFMDSEKSDDKAVIILIPVRLGGERTNMEYLEIVKGILSLEYCIGIIGGKPKQSYYFAGFQDDSLIYMDPHYCQSFVDVSVKDFPLESFHCPSPKKMSFKKMDPSCTIGLYCRNVQDFERVSEEITKILTSSKEKYPLFTFVNGHSRDYDFMMSPVREERTLFSEDENKKLKCFSTEDFVLL
ncbi:cysteine protease ATG4C [Hemicordylus capensis]|uniref:cysteine protease ATG4C n=1 Tax=Hemicordylus capensis TaxID=884348 RepID=UPI00230210D1|nr:cysteine protease ATG4C [Hemicordylus capensis]XP_053104292.1 cysteine protease ATG4C [Hemicordylus capensis]XP_053104293.1 cysteine protease ATG4C [Hemicordylus capensis]XP_053104294.1 cysteine protease ATG4C [Hemicordylus capensis]